MFDKIKQDSIEGIKELLDNKEALKEFVNDRICHMSKDGNGLLDECDLQKILIDAADEMK